MYGSRIETILSMLPQCGTVADIGTDHGIIASEILERKIAVRVIATDISAASLAKAQTLCVRSGFSAMEIRLGDGLAPLTPGEADAAVLAGMGGRLIARILEGRKDIAAGVPVFILQPMHSVRDLRGWLYRNGYRIEAERLSREGERYYCVMRIVHGQDDLLPMHMEIGRRLIEARDPLLPPYVVQLRMKNEKKIRSISETDTLKAREALGRYRALESIYREVLHETDGW